MFKKKKANPQLLSAKNNMEVINYFIPQRLTFVYEYISLGNQY